MNRIGYPVLVLVFASSYGLGLWLGKRRRKVVLAAAAVALTLVVARAYFRFYPEVEFRLFPYDVYASVHAWWLFPFALIILGIGTVRMSKRPERIWIGAFALVTFLFAVERVWLTATFDAAAFRGKQRPDGVCRQTTPYSCGAAAAATLLGRLGISVTEAEMAERCGTNAMTGTDALSSVLGLRKMLGPMGYRVGLVRTDWQGLCRLNRPAMAIMRETVLIDHWVVVILAREEGVVTANPSVGRVIVPKQKFLRRWRGLLIVVEKGIVRQAGIKGGSHEPGDNT